jgi:hypothetical protein
MDNRISATGIKDIEADTIEAQEIIVGTNNTIIDETGLQVYHPYSLSLPLDSSGYWNVHDMLEVMRVVDNMQNFEMTQIADVMGYTSSGLASLGALTLPSAIAAGGSALASSNALQGLALKQDKIHTFSNPFNLNATNTSARILSLKYTDPFNVNTTSGNLELKYTNPFALDLVTI